MPQKAKYISRNDLQRAGAPENEEVQVPASALGAQHFGAVSPDLRETGVGDRRVGLAILPQKQLISLNFCVSLAKWDTD